MRAALGTRDRWPLDPPAQRAILAEVSDVSSRRFGRYRVVEALGRGAMGEVFLAVDDVMGREVAIKTLRSFGGDLPLLSADRFRNEVRAIASLSHPGVVQVFDVDVEATPPYLVMERVPGPSLAKRLEAGPLPATEVRALGIQIAQALAAAHARGIVHRDVKPANVLAAGAGTWKLADFGVAHVPDSSLTLTGQFIGSPAYGAPEALTQGQLGPASDVYGLGAVLYEALAGRWPRSDGMTSGVAALLAPPPPLAQLAPGVPPDLAAAIMRALAFDPAHRPSADALARELAGGVGAETSPTAALGNRALVPVPPSGGVRWRRWAPWIGAGVALVLGIAIGAGRRDVGVTSEVEPSAYAPEPRATMTVRPPPDLSGKAAKDWNKIIEKIEEGELNAARKKLDEWEQRHGRTPESAELARQLEGYHPRERRGRD